MKTLKQIISDYDYKVNNNHGLNAENKAWFDGFKDGYIACMADLNEELDKAKDTATVIGMIKFFCEGVDLFNKCAKHEKKE